MNPFYKNFQNKKIHYREGFRKTCEENELLSKIKTKKIKVILLGSSSTYCTDISKNEYTWPYLLQQKFEDKFEFFNFGVPHFTTLHSNIRILNWINLVKPDLVIMYQAKNDLNYISNIPDNIEYINHDFENIQTQFAISLKERIPGKLNFPFNNFFKFKKLQSLNFDILYRCKVNTNKLIKAKEFDISNSIITKTISIASLCKSFDTKFLYIPEIVISGPHKKILEEEVYPRIEEELNKLNLGEFYNPSYIINNSQKYFFDNMHFNEKGCQIFSEIISAKLNSLNFKNKK